MFCSILSPAFAGYFIAHFKHSFDPDGHHSNWILPISILCTVQAMIPFIQKSHACIDIAYKATFLVMPFLVTTLCLVSWIADDGKIFAPFNAYTMTIQLCLFVSFLGTRFGWPGFTEAHQEYKARTEDGTIKKKDLELPLLESGK